MLTRMLFFLVCAVMISVGVQAFTFTAQRKMHHPIRNLQGFSKGYESRIVGGISTTLAMSQPDDDKTPSKIFGVESKYAVALLVFLGAAVFDFYRMHGGVPFWAEGGVL